MKYFLLAGLVSACTLVARPKPGTGSIEGHVFNSLTSAPVRNAHTRSLMSTVSGIARRSSLTWQCSSSIRSTASNVAASTDTLPLGRVCSVEPTRIA